MKSCWVITLITLLVMATLISNAQDIPPLATQLPPLDMTFVWGTPVSPYLTPAAPPDFLSVPEPVLPEADVPRFVIAPFESVPVFVIKPLQQLLQVICYVITATFDG